MIRDQQALCHELKATHRAWLGDLSEKLAPVRVLEPNVWERSTAVRYLEEEFVPRFRRETSAVDAVVDLLPPAVTVRAWAAGALIKLLRVQLAQLVQMPQSGAVFARVVNEFLRAFECWCGEVEATIGALPAKAVGPDLSRRLEQLPDGADVAVPA